MDAESAREFLLKLPHVVESQQWGDNLVFFVGDKSISGRMMCILNLDDNGQRHGVLSYMVGPERYAELIERDGLYPAPYAAKNFWVAAERWNVWRNAEWENEFRAAYDLTYAKLSPRTRAVLEMPVTARKKFIRERKKLLAERAKSKA
jgi:predicted DNA-binding protein (MmcQ/YjbR family)